MLQEEFFERTKVQLTGEEYKKVEAIYNSVQMDKDEFCKLWLKNRENKIIVELMDTIKNLESGCQALKLTNANLSVEMEALKEHQEDELKAMSDTYKRNMEEFGRKMVVHFDDDTLRYDAIAEEYGLDAICKWKLEEDIELEKEEREHLIKKL